MQLEVPLFETTARVQHKMRKLKCQINHLRVLFREALLKQKFKSLLRHELKVIIACLFQELPMAVVDEASIIMQMNQIRIENKPEQLGH